MISIKDILSMLGVEFGSFNPFVELTLENNSLIIEAQLADLSTTEYVLFQSDYDLRLGIGNYTKEFVLANFVLEFEISDEKLIKIYNFTTLGDLLKYLAEKVFSDITLLLLYNQLTSDQKNIPLEHINDSL